VGGGGGCVGWVGVIDSEKGKFSKKKEIISLTQRGSRSQFLGGESKKDKDIQGAYIAIGEPRNVLKRFLP